MFSAVDGKEAEEDQEKEANQRNPVHSPDQSLSNCFIMHEIKWIIDFVISAHKETLMLNYFLFPFSHRPYLRLVYFEYQTTLQIL